MDVVDRVMQRGDSLVFDAFAKRPDPTTGIPLPVNLAGGKAWFTAKTQITAPDENAEVRLGSAAPLSGVAIVDAAGGQVRVTVPPSATKNFRNDPMALAYDVQVMDSAGTVTTVVSGLLTVRPDVTRATS